MPEVQQQPISYEWTFPGAPVRIHLRLAVVERLKAYLAQEPVSTPGKTAAKCGILLGRVAAAGSAQDRRRDQAKRPVDLRTG